MLGLFLTLSTRMNIWVHINTNTAKHFPFACAEKRGITSLCACVCVGSIWGINSKVMHVFRCRWAISNSECLNNLNIPPQYLHFAYFIHTWQAHSMVFVLVLVNSAHFFFSLSLRWWWIHIAGSSVVLIYSLAFNSFSLWRSIH